MAYPKQSHFRMPSSKARSAKQPDIRSVAQKKFGYTELRRGQEEAIRALLLKQDTLVVMPTGAGKSAIYQIAGLMMDGPVLVISPLIALQKDQVDSIQSQDTPAEAVLINSTQKASELRENLEQIQKGRYKFIFLAPEQLRKEETIEALSKAKIALFAVDEAHCISEWGHCFRPDYLHLGHAAERLNYPVVLAMTATASARVREEIMGRLGMQKPKVLVGGFDRPNIYLRVDHFKEEEKKMEALLHHVRWAEKPGIVYTGTRKTAETIMRSLAEEGTEALYYHAGLKAAEREEIQNKFMSGNAEVIMATNAFGMGINKADIRFVYHYDASDSLDSYYQEIGRAGRDGEKAEAILFFREQDIGAQAFHTGQGKIQMEQLEEVVKAMAEQDQPVTPQEIAEGTNFSARKLTGALQRLEDAGVVETLPTGEVQLRESAQVEEAIQEAAEQQELRQEMNKERLRQMREYADTGSCRREHLLRYFGDDFHGPCRNCDNCEAASPGLAMDPSMGTRREVA